MKQTNATQEPITVDVKWVQTHHMLKTGLQSKLRAEGILPYYIIPGTTKILYKRKDVEKLIESGKIDVSYDANKDH